MIPCEGGGAGGCPEGVAIVFEVKGVGDGNVKVPVGLVGVACDVVLNVCKSRSDVDIVWNQRIGRGDEPSLERVELQRFDDVCNDKGGARLIEGHVELASMGGGGRDPVRGSCRCARVDRECSARSQRVGCGEWCGFGFNSRCTSKSG